MMVLINGLKRQPQDDEAVQLLLRWYGLEFPRPGLEVDVVGALTLQPDADDLISVLIDNLRGHGNPDIADALLDEAERQGLKYLPPEPEALDTIPPSLSASDPEDTLDGLPFAMEAGPGLTEDQAIPFLDESAEDASDAPVVDQPEESVIEEPQTPSAPPKTAEPSKAPERAVNAEPGTKSSKPIAKTGRGRKRTIAALVAVAALVVGYISWDRARYESAIAAVDNQLEMLDPLDVMAVRATVRQDVAAWTDDPSFQERLAFLDVLAGDEAQPLKGPETSWGHAAVCLRATVGGDLEGAIQAKARLERLFPDALPTLWCQAQVAESRKDFRLAGTLWAAAVKDHSTFLAGHLGVIRTSVRSDSTDGLESALERLARLRRNHPYMIAGQFTPATRAPFFTLTPVVQTEVPAVMEDGDSFIMALSYLLRAQALADAHRWQDVKREVETALAMDPLLAQAALLAVVLRGKEYDLESAQKAAHLLMELGGVSREFQMLARAVVGRTFAFLGRPDRAADLLGLSAKPGGGWLAKKFDDSKDNAITDATVLNELGRVDEALELISRFARANNDPEAIYVAHLLTLQNGQSPPADLSLPDTASAAHKAAVSHFEGSHRAAAEQAGLVAEDSDFRWITMRFVIQSQLALRQVGDALADIDSDAVPILDRIFLDGVVVRAYARLNRGNEDYKQLFAKMKSVEPTGVNRTTDLGYASFWQGDRQQANELLDEALGRNEKHRKANWLKAVLLRSQGKYTEAAPYLARSGRDVDTNPQVLFELGNVNFQLRNYDEARKMYYRSLLQDRQDLETLRGLGRAYANLPSTSGSRDLERILDNYPSSPEYAAHRAEVMKWLAVLVGVRDGNTVGLRWLDSAEQLVGARADILVERARFHEAIKEFATARKLYAQALQANSTLASAHLGLGRTALKLGDSKVARDHLTKYLEFSMQGPERQWVQEQLKEL